MFGRGAIRQLGAEVEGDRILFICTPSLKGSRAAGVVRESLGRRLAAEFDQVAQHVPREAVEAARTHASEKQVDAVVALGGGSAIGVGKGVVLGNSVPLSAIPTTYSGSEMTPIVGITDRAAGRKEVRRNAAVMPRLVIYDPEVTVELAPELSAGTGMNALAHCVEAVYSKDAGPLVPPIALDGARRIVRSLPTCVARGDDLDAREEMLKGAYLAGVSIANATMGLHHGLCHVLGGQTGAPHGVLNAIILPHVMRFNADAVPDAMSAMADAMDAGARTRDIEAAARFTSALLSTLPLPKRLRDAGVAAHALEPAATEAANNASVKANPKPVSEQEILELLRGAW